MSNSIELTTKAGVKIAVNAVAGGNGGGGGVTAHGDLTGLTTGDDHTQYQRSESTYTSSASYTVTDESVVITAGSAVTLPGAQAMAGRIVGVGAAAQTVTISPAGTDTMFDDPGNPYSLPSGNGITFVAVQIGGAWGWAIYTRNGPAFDMPKWVGESLAEGKVLRVNSSGAPAWASITAADVPNLAASKVTSGTFDVARIPTGTTTGTVAAGDDGRITGAAQKASNLSDLGSASTARTNLGLGGAATLSVGTSAGTVAAGDDSRITGAAQKASNLSDLGSASTARTNLGLGGAATLSVGTTTGTVAAGDDSRITGASQKASNLSDLGSASTARTNLGLGTAATANTGTGSTNVILGDDSRLTDARAPKWRRITFSDASYDLSATPSPAVSGSVVLQQTGTITAARTVTLPAASACPAGSEVIVNGGAGVTATNTVTVQRAGSDTINGATTSVVIGTAWGQRRFVSDGTSAWAYDDGLVRRSQNLSDLADASTARTNLGLVAIASSGSASDLSTGTVASARLSTKTVGGQGAGSAVNEPSTATSLLTSTVTLPACAAGDLLIVDAGINWVQNSAVSRNVTFAVKIGSTTMLSTSRPLATSATTVNGHLHAVIRVISTTSQAGAMTIAYAPTSAGSTGFAAAATGTATETISSGSLALDLLVTATSNTTQNYTLQSLTVTRIAA